MNEYLSLSNDDNIITHNNGLRHSLDHEPNHHGDSNNNNTEHHKLATFKLSQVDHDLNEMNKLIKIIDNQTHYNHEINESILECNSNELTEFLTHSQSLYHELQHFISSNCTITHHDDSHGHSDEHHSHEHHSHSHHIPAGVYTILYAGFVLIFGCILKYFQHRYHIAVPYTVLLLAFGIFIELIDIADIGIFGDLSQAIVDVRIVDPHMILMIFIPGLIFESAFNPNYHIFVEEAEQASMLVGPGILINSFLTGVMYYFAHGIKIIL